MHNEFPNRCMVCLRGVYDAGIKLRGSPGYSGVLALSHYPSTPNTDTWMHTYSIFTVAVNELPKINHTGSCRLHLQPILPLALLMPQFFFFLMKNVSVLFLPLTPPGFRGPSVVCNTMGL